MEQKTYKERFISSFKVHWIFYVSAAIAISCLLGLATSSPWSFLFLLAMPFWSLTQPLIEKALYPGSFQWKIDTLTANIKRAEEEQDPIKREFLLSIMSMRNANTCAIYYNYGHQSEKHHFAFLMRFYQELKRIHREEAIKLYNEKFILNT